MYKLLTEESKEKAKREYKLRRVVVVLWALVFLLTVSMLSAFPSYILSSAKEEAAKARIEALESTPMDEAGDPQAWLAGINLKLKLLSPKADQDRATPLIEKVLEKRGSGIRVTSLSWNKREGAVAFSLSGIARDRQALLAFENRLNQSGEFKDVSLPVSHLARERDISFEVKLSPK